MRLVFRHVGDRIELLRQVPVTTVVPDAAPGQSAPGVYVDSRRADDTPIARVRAYKAMAGSAEVFPAHEGERLRHVAPPRQHNAFSVVVPAPPEADHVTVVQVARGTSAPKGVAARAVTAHDDTPAMATDLAQFPLQRG